MATRTQRFYPHRFVSHAIGLSLTEASVDGEPLDLTQVWTPHALQLDATEDAPDAKQLQTTWTISGLHDVVRRSLAPDERTDPPARLVVMAEDPKSWFRSSTRVEWTGEDEVTTSLDVPVRDIHGTLEVTALLVRTVDRATPEPPYAEWKASRLADSRVASVRVHDPEHIPGSSLEVQWEDFSESEHPLRKRNHRKLLHFLELTEGAPVLYLNSHHADFQTVMQNRGTRGASAAWRDIFNRAIALPTWMALIEVAGTAIVDEGDGKPEAAEPWHAQVLNTMAPHMYPEQPRKEAYATLLGDLSIALQADDATERQIQHQKVLERLVMGLQTCLDLRTVAERALRQLRSA